MCNVGSGCSKQCLLYRSTAGAQVLVSGVFAPYDNKTGQLLGATLLSTGNVFVVSTHSESQCLCVNACVYIYACVVYWLQ